jgi:hypothetical protein
LNIKRRPGRLDLADEEWFSEHWVAHGSRQASTK